MSEVNKLWKLGDKPISNKLLPLTPPLFTPEFLVCNESGSLLAVCGPNGVMVFELPKRYPPYGAFDNNKEVVYCRTYSLDERLLCCSDTIDVRQVKFHPGSLKDNHLVVLTSDNNLRLYQISDSEAKNLVVYSVGETPQGNFPGSSTPFLECYGEIAVDFDFGHAEIEDHVNDYTQTEDNPYLESKIGGSEGVEKKLRWPVYILRGDGTVFSLDLSLNKKVKPFLKGPLPMENCEDIYEQNDACSIVCLNTNPQVVCVALANGTLVHSILMDLDEESKEEVRAKAKTVTELPSKELLTFESVELELGLVVNEDDLMEKTYKCPVLLHKDESKVNRYFATHNGGVHALTLGCLDDLNEFVIGGEDAEVTNDLFVKKTSVEYMVCTKTSSSDKVNPVIGFALYYEPTYLISLLADGSLVTLAIITTVLPLKEERSPGGNKTISVNSPLKTMLKEPFDCYIQNILKKASTQPILKLASSGAKSQEEYYELLQRVSQVFRDEYFKYHNNAHEELEKRIQALQMLKQDQQKVLKELDQEKQNLQNKAENLAEKYEDIKDKQDELLKRCEKLLMLVARRRQVPSDAEKDFLKQINDANEKLQKYMTVIDKVKEKMKYQQIKITNWKAQENKKVLAINPMQEATIKDNLKDATKKINDMIRDVNDYKRQLNIK